MLKPPPSTRQTIQFSTFMSLAGLIATTHGTPYQFSTGQIGRLADWLETHNPKFDRVRWLESIEYAIAHKTERISQ